MSLCCVVRFYDLHKLCFLLIYLSNSKNSVLLWCKLLFYDFSSKNTLCFPFRVLNAIDPTPYSNII